LINFANNEHAEAAVVALQGINFSGKRATVRLALMPDQAQQKEKERKSGTISRRVDLTSIKE
jgi:hypothetical protein